MMALEPWYNGDTSPTARDKFNAVVAAVQAHEAADSSPHGATLTQDTLIVTDSLSLPDGRTFTPTTVRLLALPPPQAGLLWPNYVGPVEDGFLQPGYDGSGGRTYTEAVANTGKTYAVVGVFSHTLPADFLAWRAGECVGVAIWTSDTSGDAYVSVQAYRRPPTGTPVAGGALEEQTSAAEWTTIWFDADTLAGGEWAPGDTLVLEVTLASTESSGLVSARISEIVLAWREGAA